MKAIQLHSSFLETSVEHKDGAWVIESKTCHAELDVYETVELRELRIISSQTCTSVHSKSIDASLTATKGLNFVHAMDTLKSVSERGEGSSEEKGLCIMLDKIVLTIETRKSSPLRVESGVLNLTRERSFMQCTISTTMGKVKDTLAFRILSATIRQEQSQFQFRNKTVLRR